jgi:hypothetical protein
MFRIILSCGDEVYDFKHARIVMTKGQDRYGARAVVYRTVCGTCEEEYRRSGDIFDFEEVAQVWVRKNNG